MSELFWVLLFLFTVVTLSYQRASLSIYTIAVAIYLGFLSAFAPISVFSTTLTWLVFVIIAVPLNVKPLRRNFITRPIFNWFKNIIPTMSQTEKEALESGDIDWEAELFSGKPNWKTFVERSAPKLTEEEQAFLDGPVEALCRVIDDWDFTMKRRDLSEEAWKIIHENGFWSFIIPKEYGGKAFSAYAQARISFKLNSRSTAVSTTVSVPNSLGPGELLLRYGTEEQKNYYLPRLCQGKDIPCFALTGPEAGSDASSMPDYGVICEQDIEGEKVLGMRLNFNKRYITFAPVATVIGLAFKLFDPDHLLGSKENLGVTVALIKRDTPGLDIGKRHYPLHTPFLNGPIYGKDVFVPLSDIIGGQAMIGQGWKMLVECLAAGRAISLPSIANGGARSAAILTGAYSQIRQQFNVPIGKFEGIQEKLAEMAGRVYMSNALTVFGVNAIDVGNHSAVASAISKYHVTENARIVANLAMDIHGGKGICMGPNNYIANGYCSTPIAITVEGANILTRNLIIYGQGAIRCHPYVLNELMAANEADHEKGLHDFDEALFAHLGFVGSNKTRAWLLALTGSHLALDVPTGPLRRYYQQVTRFSSAFAYLSDVCMGVYGGDLKRKEFVSARLGDILSYLYNITAVLKYFDDQGAHHDDLILVEWACQYLLYHIQQTIKAVIDNMPTRFIACAVYFVIFPFGAHAKLPRDKLTRKVAQILQTPSKSRSRLAEGVDLTDDDFNPIGLLERVLKQVVDGEPLEQKLHAAIKAGKAQGVTFAEKVAAAHASNQLSEAEANQLLALHEARMRVVNVDVFDSAEL